MDAAAHGDYGNHVTIMPYANVHIYIHLHHNIIKSHLYIIIPVKFGMGCGEGAKIRTRNQKSGALKNRFGEIWLYLVRMSIIERIIEWPA